MNPIVMHCSRATLLMALLIGAGSLTACGGHCGADASDNILDVYSWAGYVAPYTGTNFERETSIKGHHSTYESNHMGETKLLTGHRITM